MSAHNDPRETLRLRMLEVSLLPAGDPARAELEADLAAEGDWALREWEGLLNENERFRGALLDVPAPTGLRDELLRIPEDEFGWLGRMAASPLLRMAATVLLVLGFGGGMFYLRDYTRGGENKIEQVAELALESFAHDQDISVVTLDPGYMQRYLEGSVPFEIKIPTSMQSDMSLVGGKSGALGVYPAVYTRWSHQMEHGQSKCAIIQFRSEDFGLPESAPKEVVHSSSVKCPSTLGKQCNVVVWTEGGNGYALVADSACAMHCLGSR